MFSALRCHVCVYMCVYNDVRVWLRFSIILVSLRLTALQFKYLRRFASATSNPNLTLRYRGNLRVRSKTDTYADPARGRRTLV